MDYIFFFFLVPRNPSCYSFSSVKVACAVVTWLAVVAWVCNQVSQHSLTQYFKEVIQAELLKEARVILFGGCRSDQLKKKQQIKIHTRSFSSNLAPPAKNCNKFSYVVTFFTLIEVKLSFLLNHWKLHNKNYLSYWSIEDSYQELPLIWLSQTADKKLSLYDCIQCVEPFFVI